MTVPYPEPTPVGETAMFWQALAEGRFDLPWCTECEQPFLYPRAMCPRCWSDDLQWRRATGRGSVVAFTRVHRPAHPAFTAEAPYICAVVQLDEGPRLMTNVRDGSPVAVGDRIRLTGMRRGAWSLPVALPDATEQEERT